MRSPDSASGSMPGQPVESLHKRWARQSNALLSLENTFLVLGDTLPSYEDLLKDVRLKAPYDDAAISLDQLPELKERTIASLNAAIEAIKVLEQKSNFNLKGEVVRFESVRDQLDRIDPTALPSSTPFQSDFPNHIFNFTALQDNYPEYRDLQHQSRFMIDGDTALRNFREAMPEQRGALEDAARNMRIISGLMSVAYQEAVKKMKPLTENIGKQVVSLADSCVSADRLTTKRDPDVDIAPSLLALRKYGERLQKGNPSFLTPVEYKQTVKGYLDQAYGERERYATQLQQEEVVQLEEVAEIPDTTAQTRWNFWNLFRRK